MGKESVEETEEMYRGVVFQISCHAWVDIDGLVKASLGVENRVGKLEEYRVYLRLHDGEMRNKTGNVFGKDLQ